MCDTLMGVGPDRSWREPETAFRTGLSSPAELAAVEDLVDRARTAGIALTGPDGLLTVMTKTLIEAALEEEIPDHLCCDKHAAEGRIRADSPKGDG